MRKKFLVAGALMLTLSLPVSNTFSANTKQFSDVPPTKHFAESVYNLAERNIIGGYPDGTFKPGDSITRGQAAAIIAKLVKLDTSNVKDPGFKDVSKENGYYKAIAAMAQQGFISGYGDGSFGPNDPIKRGQMASILVKAFDLPQYTVPFSPFKDVENHLSHRSSILIIHKLGITTGTTPNTFSPNSPITRGQAAKMLRATEELMPSMVTFKPSDFGWDRFNGISSKSFNKSFEVIHASVRNKLTGNYETHYQLVLLKEGTGILSFGLHEKEDFKKFYVHIKEVNGELQLTLEETDDVLPTVAKLVTDKEEQVQNISLATMEGEKLADSVPFKHTDNGQIEFDIDNPGQYIATLRMVGGKEVRYGIDVKQNNASFYYEITTLREQLSAEYKVSSARYKGFQKFDAEAANNPGKHTVLTKDADQIATLTRDADTNLFRAKDPKKVGSIDIKFEHTISWTLGEPGDAFSGVHTGIRVNVKQIGDIKNISFETITEINPDM